ncbi:hypothetical protein [Streptomyces sp. NPDC051079]|uniref:hypothetical protein n=1 Tax=Streptomyces sp. NPDC051079 TaxID=3155043 RepID=UPI003450581A
MSTVVTVAAIALGALVGAGLQRRTRLRVGEPSPSGLLDPDGAEDTKASAPDRPA